LKTASTQVIIDPIFHGAESDYSSKPILKSKEPVISRSFKVILQFYTILLLLFGVLMKEGESKKEAQHLSPRIHL
jgi:hypothetical protein